MCVCVCVCVRALGIRYKQVHHNHKMKPSCFNFSIAPISACFGLSGATQPYTHMQCTQGYDITKLGLARTIYIRYIYGIFGREIIQYTVIYGVYIRFWPTLNIAGTSPFFSTLIYPCIIPYIPLYNTAGTSPSYNTLIYPCIIPYIPLYNTAETSPYVRSYLVCMYGSKLP